MLLTTEKLSKAYKSRKKGEPVFWAAKEVCVEIPEGKTVGLLGPSGSGNFLQRRAPFLSVERGAAEEDPDPFPAPGSFLQSDAASDPEYGGTL